mgnify:CR=1 FL=1
MLGTKLRKKVIMVVEKLEELRQIICISKSHGVEPLVGIRARLLRKGAGRWAELRGGGGGEGVGRCRDGLDEVRVAPGQGITVSRSEASLLAQAKAANACGQRILLRRLGVTAEQVDRVYLAGGFANGDLAARDDEGGVGVKARKQEIIISCG